MILVDDVKPDLHGHHMRGVVAERNKIHINRKIIDGLEKAAEDSETSYNFIFLLLATLVHEYGHWLRTQMAPDEDTPDALGYPHARGGAPEGHGESGYVAEIAIFNGFVQCDRSPSGAYNNFRIVDRWNVGHYLPIPTIEEYWKRERFEPMALDNPITSADLQMYSEVSEFDVVAKRTVAETLRQSLIPPCPCAPFLLLSEMRVSAVAEQMPKFDILRYTATFQQLDEDGVRLQKKLVSKPSSALGSSNLLW